MSAGSPRRQCGKRSPAPESSSPPIRVGTAGWALPAPVRERFPPGPSQLHRYAAVFSAGEINSSFHRPHRPATYARWAASVPDGFRFSVKLPRTVTHDARLAGTMPLLEQFLAEAGALGSRLGVLLAQLPPSLEFERQLAAGFFDDLRARHTGLVACEPRHRSWFTGEADALLRSREIARVVADPAVVPEAASPGGWPGLAYWRLHGSPRMYYSAYPAAELDRLAAVLAGEPGEAWCIFDNTAGGAAAGQALDLVARFRETGLS
jgi:uncharacterized protein YecE (DUF72 family)